MRPRAARVAARLALVERQRRFAWELAREAQTATARELVAGKTHDLLNLVQIVQLGAISLGERCPADRDVIDDLERAAGNATRSLEELMAIARPPHVVVRGPAVGPALARVVDEVRAAIDVDAHLALDPETATALSADALAHLVIGMVLDAADAPFVELYARERVIVDARWVELVCGASAPAGGDHFDVRVVEALARRAGGEVARSERRAGGSELVVALPVISASA